LRSAGSTRPFGGALRCRFPQPSVRDNRCRGEGRVVDDLLVSSASGRSSMASLNGLMEGRALRKPRSSRPHDRSPEHCDTCCADPAVSAGGAAAMPVGRQTAPIEPRGIERPLLARGRRWRPSSLFARVVAGNAALVVSVALLFGWAIANDPGESEFTFDEMAIVGVGVLLLCLFNFVLLRRAFGPLERLRRFAGEVRLADPGRRIEPSGSAEAADLARAFNDMLERLEGEQRDSSRCCLAAQEAERSRVAQELHDEVGQTLTGVLLQLANTAKRAPAELRPELAETLEAARSGLEDVRRIAVALRPDALHDLGLASALLSLCERLSQGTGISVDWQVEHELPALSVEQELVVYRVAQEALTNAVRHSGSSRALLALRAAENGVRLVVRDYGAGLGELHAGTGLRGMRERAALIGATLSIADAVDGGARVALAVPVGEAR
jgi:two-component system sensor histidine kinase UhpB